jgi:hypothetical protein
MVKEKVIIVPGTAFKKKSLEPRPLLRERLDFAIKEFNTEKYLKIICCGGKTQSFKGKPLPSEAKIMKKYLVKHGIKPNKILCEERSTNTIGNFVYTKGVLEKIKVFDGIIITNKVFWKRTRHLESQIFGKGFNFEVVSCKDAMDKNLRKWIHFSESFWSEYCYAFFFDGIKRGDTKEILKRLKHKDANYPPNYREDYVHLNYKFFFRYKSNEKSKPRQRGFYAMNDNNKTKAEKEKIKSKEKKKSKNQKE